MPQQQTIRDLLDHHAIPIVTQVEELAGMLSALADKVKLVITDSQAFKEVNQIVPADIPLTSFSILFARHKGNLQQLMEGVGIIVLDHVIVAGNQTYSMAQHGELLHPSEIMRAMVAAAEKPLRK